MSAELLDNLFQKIRSGDFQAADQLLLIYEPQLRLIVRRQLSARLRVKFDSLDVVQSVWARVLHDFRENGCRITSTEHLRNFLVRVTRHCLIDRFRHFRVALEREQPANQPSTASAADARQPQPSEVAQANELWQNMLAICPPKYHELLQLKRQGLALLDISARTGLHPDSVRRIIRKLARTLSCSQDDLTA